MTCDAPARITADGIPMFVGRRAVCVQYNGVMLLYPSRAAAVVAAQAIPTARRWSRPGKRVWPSLCALCDGWHLKISSF